MKTKPWLAGALLALQLVLAQAAPLETGAPWPALNLADQHDKPVTLDPARLTVVVFAAERKPGDWAQEVIELAHKEAIAAGRLALILDVSRMPSLITSMFAMPAFRARPFPILVAREAAPVADLPKREGAVTVLRLAGGKVAAIEYAGDAAALEALLKAPPTPTQQKDKP
jgi:hypothetical protein